MTSRNVGNYNTLFSNSVVTNLRIQNPDVPLIIYGVVPESPSLKIDIKNNITEIFTDVTIYGNVSAAAFDITGADINLFHLAGSNIADTWDLGLNVKYVVGGITYYGGVARIAGNAHKSWIFYKDVITVPGNTISLNHSNYASLLLDRLYTLDGTEAAPAMSFVQDETTGVYLKAPGVLGISAGGVDHMEIGASLIQFNFDSIFAGMRKNVVSHPGNTLTLDHTHYMVELTYDTDATDIMVTLPDLATNSGREYILIKVGDGGGDVIISTNDPGEFIDDGVTTQIVLTDQYDRVTFIAGSTQWYTV